jgi:hypothetical protein
VDGSRTKNLLKLWTEVRIEKKPLVNFTFPGAEQSHPPTKTTPQAGRDACGFAESSFVGEDNIARLRLYPSRPSNVVFLRQMFHLGQVQSTLS